MDEIRRRDKLFVVIFALCALVMAIANPSEYDIRSVAWDVAMFMVAAAAVFWFFSELGDQIFSGASQRDVFISKPKTRKELIDLAGEMTGIEENALKKMTDVELSGLVGQRSGATAKQGQDMAPLGTILVASFRLVAKVVVKIAKVIIYTPRAIANLPKTIKRWKKGLVKIWKEEAK